MKRRSFLKSIFAALVSVTLAKELTAAAPEKPLAPVLDDYHRMIDLIPTRMNRIGGEWVHVPHAELIPTEQGGYRPNPEYYRAEAEVELWVKKGQSACSDNMIILLVSPESGEPLAIV